MNRFLAYLLWFAAGFITAYAFTMPIAKSALTQLEECVELTEEILDDLYFYQSPDQRWTPPESQEQEYVL